jgi:hypothetical protein
MSVAATYRREEARERERERARGRERHRGNARVFGSMASVFSSHRLWSFARVSSLQVFFFRKSCAKPHLFFSIDLSIVSSARN